MLAGVCAVGGLAPPYAASTGLLRLESSTAAAEGYRSVGQPCRPGRCKRRDPGLLWAKGGDVPLGDMVGNGVRPLASSWPTWPRGVARSSRFAPASNPVCIVDDAVRRAAWQAGRALQVLRVAGAGGDHPFLLHVPEGRYLKAVFGRVVETASTPSQPSPTLPPDQS